MALYDLLGNIAVIHPGLNKNEKLRLAKKLLQKSNIKTIVEKLDKIKGRLRTIKVKHVLGKKTLIAKVKENNCEFIFNISSCYFSTRLSNERKEIANKIKKKDRVLVMFSGVGVYPIVIYKVAKPREIIGIELGKDCHKYALQNLKLNKVNKEKVKLIQGDVNKKIIKKLRKFDVIVMPRPNLKESFLKQALIVSRKNTMIYYYAFGHINDLNKIKENLLKEVKKLKKKIKILKVVRAGDIAPYKFRYRIEIKVL